MVSHHASQEIVLQEIVLLEIVLHKIMLQEIVLQVQQRAKYCTLGKTCLPLTLVHHFKCSECHILHKT